MDNQPTASDGGGPSGDWQVPVTHSDPPEYPSSSNITFTLATSQHSDQPFPGTSSDGQPFSTNQLADSQFAQLGGGAFQTVYQAPSQASYERISPVDEYGPTSVTGSNGETLHLLHTPDGPVLYANRMGIQTAYPFHQVLLAGTQSASTAAPVTMAASSMTLSQAAINFMGGLRDASHLPMGRDLPVSEVSSTDHVSGSLDHFGPSTSNQGSRSPSPKCQLVEPVVTVTYHEPDTTQNEPPSYQLLTQVAPDSGTQCGAFNEADGREAHMGASSTDEAHIGSSHIDSSGLNLAPQQEPHIDTSGLGPEDISSMDATLTNHHHHHLVAASSTTDKHDDTTTLSHLDQMLVTPSDLDTTRSSDYGDSDEGDSNKENLGLCIIKPEVRKSNRIANLERAHSPQPRAVYIPAPYEISQYWCDDCQKMSVTECELHPVSTVTDRIVPTRAWASLPSNTLKIQNNPDGTFGVFSKRQITKRTVFGPFQATLVDSLDRVPVRNFVLQVEQNGLYYYVDASDESMCNWMMFVRPAENFTEQNVVAYQQGPSIYYQVIKPIEAKVELKVWYAAHYAHHIGASTYECSQEDTQTDNRWPCYECSKRFRTSAQLQRHLAVHDDPNASVADNDEEVTEGDPMEMSDPARPAPTARFSRGRRRAVGLRGVGRRRRGAKLPGQNEDGDPSGVNPATAAFQS